MRGDSWAAPLITNTLLEFLDLHSSKALALSMLGITVARNFPEQIGSPRHHLLYLILECLPAIGFGRLVIKGLRIIAAI